jgi:hypothetical protein
VVAARAPAIAALHRHMATPEVSKRCFSGAISDKLVVVAAGHGPLALPGPHRRRPGFEKELARRTLTNLYNQRPAWLAQAHAALDAAVAAAYGWADWSAAMPDDEILRRLLALNRERAGT